jgi:large subunit ribosomal protein L1
MKRGKRYRALREALDRTRQYSPGEAVATVRSMQSAKFPEAVEAHIRLGVNVRHADQQVRGTMVLPNGLGRDVSVAVFAQGDKAREAEAAGAVAVGAEDLAERVSGGWTDFDVAIATPDMMPVVARLGRILGPQGKMPNPKVGTVTEDVGRAVEQAKAGRIEYRTDRTGIVHLVIGRADFEERKLLENYAALIEEIVRAKPAAAKGRYIRSVTLSTTMGPGVHVDPTKTRDILEEPVAGAATAQAGEAASSDGAADGTT